MLMTIANSKICILRAPSAVAIVGVLCYITEYYMQNLSSLGYEDQSKLRT